MLPSMDRPDQISSSSTASSGNWGSASRRRPPDFHGLLRRNQEPAEAGAGAEARDLAADVLMAENEALAGAEASR